MYVRNQFGARRGVGDFSWFDPGTGTGVDTSGVSVSQATFPSLAASQASMAALPLTTVQAGGLDPATFANLSLPASAVLASTGIPTSWMLGLAGALGVLILAAVIPSGGRGRR